MLTTFAIWFRLLITWWRWWWWRWTSSLLFFMLFQINLFWYFYKLARFFVLCFWLQEHRLQPIILFWGRIIFRWGRWWGCWWRSFSLTFSFLKTFNILKEWEPWSILGVTRQEKQQKWNLNSNYRLWILLISLRYKKYFINKLHITN